MKKLYRHATLIDAKEPQDLLVDEGKFTAIAPRIEADAAETIDLIKEFPDLAGDELPAATA